MGKGGYAVFSILAAILVVAFIWWAWANFDEIMANL